MKATIFAQKKKTKEGREFYTYLARLTKKDGSSDTVEAKFREECGAPDPKKCPLNIEVDKGDGNISEKTEKYTSDTGEELEAVRRRLWVSKWVESDDKYVDESLNDYV